MDGNRSIRIQLLKANLGKAKQAAGERINENIRPFKMHRVPYTGSKGTPPKATHTRLKPRKRETQPIFPLAEDVHLPADVSPEDALSRLDPRINHQRKSKFTQRMYCCRALVAYVEQRKLLRGVSGTIVALCCLTIVSNAFAKCPLIDRERVEDLQIEGWAVVEAYYRLMEHKEEVEEVLTVYGEGIKRVPLPTERPEHTTKKSVKKAKTKPSERKSSVKIVKPKIKPGRTRWWSM
jgi:hypothetical protein